MYALFVYAFSFSKSPNANDKDRYDDVPYSFLEFMPHQDLNYA